MGNLNKEFWNKKYAEDTYVYGKAPDAFLEENVHRLKKGKALDVASGEGRNSVFLSQKGFEVEGVDSCEAAIEKAKKLAADTGVEVNFESKDLDFFLMPMMAYDSIVMTYYHCQQRFFSEIQRGLKDGGILLLEAYLVEHLRLENASYKPEIEECFRPNEVLQNLFKTRQFSIMYYSEFTENDKALVRCMAKKVAPR